MIGFAEAVFLRLLNSIVLFDRLVQESLSQFRHPGLDLFFQYITWGGSPLIIIALGELLALYFLSRKKFLEAVFINIVLVSTWLMINYLKILFGRSRPLGEALTAATGYSLPSGHAMIALIFYGFLAYLLWKKWPSTIGKAGVALMTFLILLIGSSRLYLNVHYLSDVLAGYLCGAIMLWLFIRGLHWAKGKYAP